MMFIIYSSIDFLSIETDPNLLDGCLNFWSLCPTTQTKISDLKKKSKILSKIMFKSKIENVSKNYQFFWLKKSKNHFKMNDKKMFHKFSVFCSFKNFILTFCCCLLINNIIKFQKAFYQCQIISPNFSTCYCILLIQFSMENFSDIFSFFN